MYDIRSPLLLVFDEVNPVSKHDELSWHRITSPQKSHIDKNSSRSTIIAYIFPQEKVTQEKERVVCVRAFCSLQQRVMTLGMMLYERLYLGSFSFLFSGYISAKVSVTLSDSTSAEKTELYSEV